MQESAVIPSSCSAQRAGKFPEASGQSHARSPRHARLWMLRDDNKFIQDAKVEYTFVLPCSVNVAEVGIQKYP